MREVIAPETEPPDPILAALELVDAAEQAHSAACNTLDEIDDASVHRCNAACDHAAAVRRGLLGLLPTTLGGLRALAEHHSRWCEQGAEDGFAQIARALAACESERPFSTPSMTEAEQLQAHTCLIPHEVSTPLLQGSYSGIPGPTEIRSAWSRLATTARDQIGFVVLDMVLQEFIHGDACVVGGQPEDRPFPDESDEHAQIRGMAAEASNQRLNELTPLIYGLFPDLFGQPDENPMWCANPGPGPSAGILIQKTVHPALTGGVGG